ncbi:MAG TPA: dihydrolipoamide acetyltransferase family protein [Thermoanaerobaculia bacterium]|jgi:2-oxoglutarate dehydrogenase E2 component (dihydrolipoamide succinyltransferase)
MATEVLMPQMGESIAEATITRWLVKVGEKVERDQPLLEISTDKVDSEIPSPATGVLLEVRHQEDETVPVNEIVGLIGEPGEATAFEPAPAPAAAAPAPAAAKDDGGAEKAGGEMPLEERLRRYSSPLVRNIAKKEGVDLGAVAGTGLHGRVTKKDILAYLEQRRAPAPAPAAPTPAARPAGVFSVPAYHAGENVEIVPMSRIRQITADHMIYSKATSAHVTTVFHVDMSRVAAARRRTRAKFEQEVGTKLTFMPFIFRAVAKAIRAWPILNAAVDGANVVYKKDVNLGMAVAMGHGLIVPVLRRADELSLVGLARAANDLADRARQKKLKPEETQGGTFTITNPGVFGSLFGTPVINQPQVAILGIGTIEKRPVVQTDEDGHDRLAIRTMSYFALTFDHRLIDGADADHFMNAVKATLEDDAWDELDPYLP